MADYGSNLYGQGAFGSDLVKAQIGTDTGTGTDVGTSQITSGETRNVTDADTDHMNLGWTQAWGGGTPVLNTLFGSQTYAATNVSTDRSFDADTVVIAELADVVGTLISDLRDKKLIA